MTETIVLGGGCFWCVEAVFSAVRGVLSTVSGYSGGDTQNPDYRAVCSGESGHAEVVQVCFDPAIIDCRTLLNLFFDMHDPTTLNRQGNDVGTQYRSVIFYTSDTQQKIAQALIAEHAHRTSIVTELKPATAFFAAEEEHQRFFARNPEEAYCRVVIAPKLDSFRKRHGERHK